MAACCARRRVWTAHDPFVVGEPVGSPREVIPTVNVMGLPPGRRVWVKGAGVQALIDAGWVEPVNP